METIFSLKVLAPMLVLIFALNSCSRDDNEISYDLTGSWKVFYYMDGNRKITKTKDNTEDRTNLDRTDNNNIYQRT